MTGQPTDSELEIMKLLWRHGSLSAREVHDHIAPSLDWSISTTRTMLERMKGKGLLSREAVHGIAVYAAIGSKVQVLAGVIRRMARSVLEVDGDLPVNAFSGSSLLSAEDLAEIAILVNEPEGRS